MFHYEYILMCYVFFVRIYIYIGIHTLYILTIQCITQLIFLVRILSYKFYFIFILISL